MRGRRWKRAELLRAWRARPGLADGICSGFSCQCGNRQRTLHGSVGIERAIVAAPPFFAYELLSDDSRDADPVSFLEFAPEHVDSAHLLLDWLLRSSPERCLLFTSDWQFGPKEPRRFGPINLKAFWKLHDSRTLLLNADCAIEGPD